MSMTREDTLLPKVGLRQAFEVEYRGCPWKMTTSIGFLPKDVPGLFRTRHPAWICTSAVHSQSSNT